MYKKHYGKLIPMTFWEEVTYRLHKVFNMNEWPTWACWLWLLFCLGLVIFNFYVIKVNAKKKQSNKTVHVDPKDCG